MDLFPKIDQPTLLVNEEIARQNIQRMAQKISRAGVSFRPHFKTHQSAEIGEWFRDEGIDRITVSSVEMAEYFAEHGWKDVLIAFSMNTRQMARIEALAQKIHLGLLIENLEAVEALSRNGKIAADIWIKVDAGYHRTGIPWEETQTFVELAERTVPVRGLKLRGLLTHSGNTYHCRGKEEVSRAFREGVDRLNTLRDELESRGFTGLDVSVGDTPGSSLCDDLSGIDELRPGNFIFYDAQQLQVGAGEPEQIAVVVACPVVAVHPQRRQVVIYGGAVHLAKDLLEVDGETSYGLIAELNENGWVNPIKGAVVKSLSQEHGILQFKDDRFKEYKVGGLAYVIPAHSCLTVQVLRKYMTLSGQVIRTMD